MRVSGIASALSCATLIQCGFIDTIEDAVEHAMYGMGIDSGELADSIADIADKDQSVMSPLIDNLMARMPSDSMDKLGAIPEQAFSAWRAVVEEVPNGASKLVDEVSKIVRARTPKPKSRKPIKDSNFLYHVEDERFPDSVLRVKSPDVLGVDDTKQYSGYLDSESDKHLFFWFFEARNDPENAPVVLWLNGGPGCSSLTGLFFELGPASISPDLKPVRNPNSWNNNTNVIFLDQPVSTGFSYTDGDEVVDTVTAGKDTYAFLELFFKQFPEYADRDFHIAGESYAGHYIPVFASEIVSHDDRSFNLTSVMMGNYLSDARTQYDYYEPQVCGGGAYPSVLSEDECQGMLDAQPRCNSLIDSCYETGSAWVCVPATIYCNNVMLGPYQKTGLNVYDIRKECGDENSLCYPELNFIDQYLNLDEVKEALGTSNIETYQGCNFDVNGAFLFNGDWMQPYHRHITELANLELPILSYAGDADVICNTLGVSALTENLPWYGQEEFAAKKFKPWVTKHSEKTNGGAAGTTRNVDAFTFVNIYGAGHMVPYDQPENSLEMFERWISGEYKLA